jgi:hypothetical protein
MNQVIIVGHSPNGVAEVERVMQNLGMKASLPSRRDGMLPAEITSALCRAHRVPTDGFSAGEVDFHQISTAPVWHGLARDLLLGNQDQDLWGWADTQSIFLLDYWRQLGPSMAFVLVYDDPKKALAESAGLDATGPLEPDIQGVLANWNAYNKELLRFFLQHPDRCLLVHARQVTSEQDLFLQQAQMLLGTARPTAIAQPAADLGRSRSSAVLQALRVSACEPGAAMQALIAETAESFILDHLLTDWHAGADLYDQLQKAANLPRPQNPDAGTASESAWKSLVAQRRTAGDVISQLHDERFLLMSQLHLAQEELERLYLKEKAWKKPLTKKPKVAEPKALLGAADRVKQQLTYRIGNTVVKRSRSLGGWLGMPFALVGEIRSFRAQEKHNKKKLPPLHTYDDAKEAERVKNQLSYRMGSVILKNGSSPLGWIRMPFALRREFRTFHKKRGEKKPSRPS